MITDVKCFGVVQCHSGLVPDNVRASRGGLMIMREIDLILECKMPKTHVAHLNTSKGMLARSHGKDGEVASHVAPIRF